MPLKPSSGMLGSPQPPVRVFCGSPLPGTYSAGSCNANLSLSGVRREPAEGNRGPLQSVGGMGAGDVLLQFLYTSCLLRPGQQALWLLLPSPACCRLRSAANAP